MSLFDEMSRRYRAGEIPWDHELPPPELIALANDLPPGRVLDLGCGPGRACMYFARLGWRCDGVDFIPQAVAMAEQRAYAAGVADRARFHCASVTQLDFLHPPYDLAFDVGCAHNLRGGDLADYASELARLLRPAAQYVLFARLAERGDAERGLAEQTIRDTFAPNFRIERAERGETTFGDTVAPSAWFWMRREGTVDGRP